MAGGGSSSGQVSKSGRRSLEADLNLVPFIDLLSVCICFLLMTAVWMQVASLDVKQATGTEGSDSKEARHEVDVRFEGAERVRMVLKAPGGKKKEWNTPLSEFPARVDELVKAAGSAEKIGSGFVTPAKGVSYGKMIAVMDALRDRGIRNLGVVPVGGT